MNIDTEKLDEFIKNGKVEGERFVDIIKECEIKPVDCNECMTTRRLESFVCASCVDYYSHLTSHFKPKPKEWYEDESNFPCLCWCDGSNIRLIKSSHVFNGDRCFTSGAIIAFDNATPLTKEEVLKYCAGEK